MIARQEAEDKALFNQQYYQDITQRSDIQNMLRILDDNQKKADTRVAAQAAITGATPEQQLANREVNRRTYADALADIASNAAQMRDQYVRDYQGRKSQTFAQRLGMQDQLAGIYNNQATQWANAAGNAFKGGGQLFAKGIGSIDWNKNIIVPPPAAVDPNAAVNHVDYPTVFTA